MTTRQTFSSNRRTPQNAAVLTSAGGSKTVRSRHPSSSATLHTSSFTENNSVNSAAGRSCAGAVMQSSLQRSSVLSHDSAKSISPRRRCSVDASAAAATVNVSKEMSKAIALLSSRRQYLQRLLANCVKEAAKLVATANVAAETTSAIEKTLQQQKDHMVQLSAVTNAVLASSPMLQRRRSSVAQLQRHANSFSGSTPDSSHGSTKKKATTEASPSAAPRPPFSLFGSELDAFERRSHSLCPPSPQHQDPHTLGAAGRSRSKSPQNMNLVSLSAGSMSDPSHGLLPATVTSTLSVKETATVFQHCAMLEALLEKLSEKLKGASSMQQEMAMAKFRGEFLATLLDRALDAEVQLLHHARSASTSHAEHAANPAAASALPASVLVNASPLFPEMTLHDFDKVTVQLDQLSVQASSLVLSIHRCVEDAKARSSGSLDIVQRQLQRGVRMAETKQLEAQLHMSAATNEEHVLRDKKEQLHSLLAAVRRSIDATQSTLHMRSAMRAPDGANRVVGVGSYEGLARYRVVTPSPYKTAASVRSLSVGSAALVGSGPFVGRDALSPSPEKRRLELSWNNTKLATSPRVIPDMALPSSPMANSDVRSPALSSVDIVGDQLRTQLQCLVEQEENIRTKIAKIDDALRLIQLGKRSLREDLRKSALRSATCAAMSPARQEDGRATPTSSPTSNSKDDVASFKAFE